MKNLSKLVLSGVLGFSALSGVMMLDSKEVSAKTTTKANVVYVGKNINEVKMETVKVPSFDLSKYVSKSKVKQAEKDFNKALEYNIGTTVSQVKPNMKYAQVTHYSAKKKVTVKQISTKGSHTSFEVSTQFTKAGKMKSDTVVKNYINVNKKTGKVYDSNTNYKLISQGVLDSLQYIKQFDTIIYRDFVNNMKENKKLDLRDYTVASNKYKLLETQSKFNAYVNDKGNVVINVPYLSGGYKTSNIKYNGLFDTKLKPIGNH